MLRSLNNYLLISAGVSCECETLTTRSTTEIMNLAIMSMEVDFENIQRSFH